MTIWQIILIIYGAITAITFIIAIMRGSIQQPESPEGDDVA